MAVKLSSGFSVKSKEVIDDRLVLTKAAMLSMKKTGMPEKYFALCSDDNLLYVYDKSSTPNEETGYFTKATSSSSGGSSTIDEDIVATIDVGGIYSGKQISSGTTLTDFAKSLLVKPEDADVVITTNPSSLIFEKGTAVDSLSVTVNVTVPEGGNDIVKISIKNGDEVLSEVENQTSLSYDLIAITDNSIFTIEITDNTGYVTTRELVITFVNPYYYGVIDDLNQINLQDLTKVVKELNSTNLKIVTDKDGAIKIINPTSEQNVVFTADNQYLVILINKEENPLSDINDGNFSNIDSFNRTEVNLDSVDYYMYTSEVPVTCNNYKYTIF